MGSPGIFWCLWNATMIFLTINWPNVMHCRVNSKCCSYWAAYGIPVWQSARKKWRYDFEPTKEVPVYHTGVYHLTSSPGTKIKRDIILSWIINNMGYATELKLYGTGTVMWPKSKPWEQIHKPRKSLAFLLGHLLVLSLQRTTTHQSSQHSNIQRQQFLVLKIFCLSKLRLTTNSHD